MLINYWKDKSGIYQIICLKNNKVYIGSAINIYNRLNAHLCELRRNKHYNNYLQNSWNKYGEENFEFKIIEYVTNKNNLIKREQYWLDKIQSYNRNNGFNICKVAGSSLGVKVSNKTKEKLKRIKNKPVIQLSRNGDYIKEWIGVREAARQLNIRHGSIVNCANKLIPTYKDSIWVYKEDYLLGSYTKKVDRVKKPVLQYDICGEFIKEWESVKSASIGLNIKDSNISQCCLGKAKSAGGFIWKHKYDNYKRKINIKSSKSKPVLQFKKINGDLKLIREWDSLISIQNTLNISRKEISKCCHEKRESYEGYIWKFKNNEDIDI